MAKDLHTVSLIPGTSISDEGRIKVGAMTVSNAAGSGAGAAVTVSVAPPAGHHFPGSSYQVTATPSQDAVCNVSSKSAAGFTLTLYPRLAANTIAAGTVDLHIIG